MSEDDSLIKVEGVSKEYRKRDVRITLAVDDVSFDVMRGETFGLVGQSGGGKTTLGLMVLGLLEPTKGEIRFDGQRVDGVGEKVNRPRRRHMQMVSQNPLEALNPTKTVGQSIELPLINFNSDSRRERTNRVSELLELVGLEAKTAQRYPHEFSGGQAQRICIARALALEPAFIFLDEPVSALDVSIQAQILNLLKDLQEQIGLTYLFVAHDMSVVKFMSDRMAVMQNGKIVEIGTVEDIVQNPKSPYTQALLASVL